MRLLPDDGGNWAFLGVARTPALLSFQDAVTAASGLPDERLIPQGEGDWNPHVTITRLLPTEREMSLPDDPLIHLTGVRAALTLGRNAEHGTVAEILRRDPWTPPALDGNQAAQL